MVMIGAITLARGALLFVTQIVGAIAAAALVSALFTGGLNVSTTLASTTSIAQGVIIEMILTGKKVFLSGCPLIDRFETLAQLVFTIFMLAAEKHSGNFIAPVGKHPVSQFNVYSSQW